MNATGSHIEYKWKGEDGKMNSWKAKDANK
jgi:hypothetical protein